MRAKVVLPNAAGPLIIAQRLGFRVQGSIKTDLTRDDTDSIQPTQAILMNSALDAAASFSRQAC